MAVDYITRLTFEDEEGVLEEYNIRDSRVDNLHIPTKTSELYNDSNYIEDADYTHTDNNYTNTDKNLVATIMNKVTKEEGKGLSTNDLTNELLAKINNSSDANHSHANKILLDQIDTLFTSEKEALYDSMESKLNGIYDGFGVDLSKPKMLITNPALASQKANIDWENIQVSTNTDYSNMAATVIKVADTSGASTTIKKSSISIIGKTETPGIIINQVNSPLKAELNINGLTFTNLQGNTLTINANTGISKAESAVKDEDGNNIKNTYATKNELKTSEDNISDEIDDINSFLSNINHNCLYRGENVTKYLTDGSLWDRIKGLNGYKKFEDLYLGDYIVLDSNINAPGSTNGDNVIIIAGFNFINNLYDNHLVMIPARDFGDAAMANAESEDGYVHSKMHTEILGDVSAEGTINAQLSTIFGEHLKTFSTRLTNSIVDDKSASYADTSVQSVLLGEYEVIGSRVFSSSPYDIGDAIKKLPIFNFNQEDINPTSYWLKDIFNEEECLIMGTNGIPENVPITEMNKVRPKFALG